MNHKPLRWQLTFPFSFFLTGQGCFDCEFDNVVIKLKVRGEEGVSRPFWKNYQEKDFSISREIIYVWELTQMESPDSSVTTWVDLRKNLSNDVNHKFKVKWELEVKQPIIHTFFHIFAYLPTKHVTEQKVGTGLFIWLLTADTYRSEKLIIVKGKSRGGEGAEGGPPTPKD